MCGEPWSFLTARRWNALLAAPDRSTWAGRRDHAILSVALQTGLRVSEIINLRRRDIVTGTGAHIRCDGKGRKQRCTPLRQEITKVLDVWLRERGGMDDDPLFPTMRGTKLSRDALERLVQKHTSVALKRCPQLTGKRVSPHVLRHIGRDNADVHGRGSALEGKGSCADHGPRVHAGAVSAGRFVTRVPGGTLNYAE